MWQEQYRAEQSVFTFHYRLFPDCYGLMGIENKEHLNPANRDTVYSLCLNSDVCTEIKMSDENGGVRALCDKWKADFKV